MLSGCGQIAIHLPCQSKTAGHRGNEDRCLELRPEKLRADVDLVNIELRQGIMDEAIAIQPGAETAGDACGVKAEFEMFLFALLGLSKRFFYLADWYEVAVGRGYGCFLVC